MTGHGSNSSQPPLQRRSRHDLEPGQSPLAYYGGWQHFWLHGVRPQVDGVNRVLIRHPFLYAALAICAGASFIAAGLLLGLHVTDENWPAPVLIAAGGLMVIAGIGGLVSAIAHLLVDERDGQE